jgi:hypothetical protein
MTEAPQVVKDLVARFAANLDVYKSKSCDEADLRQEFLNPFFEALGWDMENKAGYAGIRTLHEQEAVQRQISATDAEIDRLVYELYGLTEEDVKIVEESTGGKS